MVDILFIISGCASLLAAAYKYRDLRQAPDNRPQRALTVGLVFLGLTFLSAAPTIYTSTDRLLGIPNGMRLVAHICLVVFAGCIAQMLLHWAYPPQQAAARARHRLLGYAAIVAVLTAPLPTVGVAKGHLNDPPPPQTRGEASRWKVVTRSFPTRCTRRRATYVAEGIAAARCGCRRLPRGQTGT